MDARILFVIIGVTGNQGGSVARTILLDPTYRIRGITRNPTSAASLHLTSLGVEMVQADLNDPATLPCAFRDAHTIFSVTDFWSLYFSSPNLTLAQESNKPIGEIAYEQEYTQGRNIADAASKVPSLERFVVSMLSSPRKWSQGHYQNLWHYESKADMITYIKTQQPELAKKMSELNMGVFFHSWQIVGLLAPNLGSDGVYNLGLPCEGKRPCPLVDPRRDTGVFVRALLEVEPGVQVLGETSLRSWREWLQLWGRVQGKEVRYEQVSIEYYEEVLSKSALVGFGTEIAEMFEFVSVPGLDMRAHF